MLLSIPLNFIGFIYREIRQGLTDIEQMFDLLDVDQEIKDKPNAPDLDAGEGSIAFDNVHFAYDPQRPILKGASTARRAKPSRLLALLVLVNRHYHVFYFAFMMCKVAL